MRVLLFSVTFAIFPSCTVQYNVQNKAMVQLFVTRFSDKISSYMYETELAEPPKRQHGEKSHLESAE